MPVYSASFAVITTLAGAKDSVYYERRHGQDCHRFTLLMQSLFQLVVSEEVWHQAQQDVPYACTCTVLAWREPHHSPDMMQALCAIAQEGVMGRMQCLESAVSKPALWSISSTPLHARPKAAAFQLKVCTDIAIR